MTTPTAPGSTGYGVDIYGTVLYGYSQPKSLSVEPFIATQTDYGRITLNWQTPNNTDWSKLRLVRNSDGYPSTPIDGLVLLEARTDSVRNVYDDVGLTQGLVYYYTVFMSQDAAAYDSGTTYIQTAVVYYNNTYWQSLQPSNSANTPSIGSSWWAPTTYFPVWYPAGSVASMAVKDHGYSERLYDRTPQPYKIVKSDLFANTTIDNPQLAQFLSLFGYSFNGMKSEYDNLLTLNDADLVSADNLELLGQQFGVSTDYISSPRLRRERVKNASVNYRLKGSWQGIHNAIAEITGWDSELEVGPNMMLNLDQASFAHPSYDLWTPAVNYAVGMYVEYNGYNYKCLVGSYGSAQAPTGINSSNTWWSVQTNSADTTTLLNPSTQGFSTWGKYFNGGLTNSVAVLVGVPNPNNTSYNAWNALGMKMSSPVPYSGTTGMTSIATLSTPTWSNANNYVVNNYVLYNTFYYKSVRTSGPGTPYGFITPGTDDLHWELQASNVGVGRGQFVRDGIPIPKIRSWDAVINFEEGDTVQYLGILYTCLTANKSKAPTGHYSSNAYWQYISSSEQVFTASSYTSRLVAATNVTSNMVIDWFDEDGNDLGTSQIPTNPTFLAKFDADYTVLNGTSDNSLNATYATLPAASTLWESTYGIARVNPTTFSALGTKPKRTALYITDTRATGSIAATFGVDFKDTVNYSHGIMFRSNGTNYWFATRTQLILFNGGTETVKATWTRLNDWDRMVIVFATSTITVSKYKRDGSGNLTQLANVTDSTLNTQTQHGIIHRYALGT